VGLTPHPHLECRGPRKSRAILLLTLRAFVAYKKGENYLPTLNATMLRYLNQMMMCFIGTWLNAMNATNFSKNLRTMRLVQFKLTVLLLLFPAL